MSESLSQSMCTLLTLMKLPLVSPLVHCAWREREKNVAFFAVMVVRTAVRSANPCIKIAPVSTSCAIATTRPLSSYFRPSRNASTRSGDSAAAATTPRPAAAAAPRVGATVRGLDARAAEWA